MQSIVVEGDFLRSRRFWIVCEQARLKQLALGRDDVLDLGGDFGFLKG